MIQIFTLFIGYLIFLKLEKILINKKILKNMKYINNDYFSKYLLIEN